MKMPRSFHITIHTVMAGLVPAIHVTQVWTGIMDGRDKPGHDGFER
jgi:hypothetical protein